VTALALFDPPQGLFAFTVGLDAHSDSRIALYQTFQLITFMWVRLPAMTHQGQLLLLLQLLIALQAASAYTYTSWHECSAQAVYGGMYGAEVLGNLSDFRSNLLGHVWKSFDPHVTYAEVNCTQTA
jgi:hypothetical protein